MVEEQAGELGDLGDEISASSFCTTNLNLGMINNVYIDRW
jgi:hypothetical protein